MNNINRRSAVSFSLLHGLPLIFSPCAGASTPIPPPTPLREYIERSSPLIFSGVFEGMKYISKKLGANLYDKNADIPSAELKFIAEKEAGGGGFMDISKARLLFARPEEFNRANLRGCFFESIYVPYTLNFESTAESDVYFRSILKKESIFFLSGPGRYGVNSASFPDPIFSILNIANWSDGKPLPLSDLGRVSDLARNSGYLEISKDCKKVS